jgi:hypothetical protein
MDIQLCIVNPLLIGKKTGRNNKVDCNIAGTNWWT